TSLCSPWLAPSSADDLLIGFVSDSKRAFPLSTSAIVVFVIACGNAAGASEKVEGCGKTGADA
ncbi:hypothetical protein ABXT28_21360, partial [Ralstonia sp. SM1878_UCD538_TZ35]|nr:hypothetical protein [Ralstonia pseudosolanacearum]